MLLNDPEDPVFLALDQFLKGLGLNLVELVLHTKNGTTAVQLVLHSPEGLGINELSKAHRLLVPQLELLLKTEDFSIEAGSPGLERNLKFRRELGFYIGKKMRLYLAGASDWEDGVLVAAGAAELTFRTVSGERGIEISRINKAKLHDL